MTKSIFSVIVNISLLTLGSFLLFYLMFFFIISVNLFPQVRSDIIIK